MVFGRWKKSVRDDSSGGEVDGMIRRGLAETTGRLPSEMVSRRPKVEGRDPYDQSGRHVRKMSLVNPARKGSGARSPYSGAGNPYNTAGDTPSEKKTSWDDVAIDKRERNR
ncbi:MAG: hypothetical protein AMJ59_25035 [Gammaproteobacteria bacterium SG8_31]|jgi:hypothetical protein|nr:MAG: hypothetical protein AMJ59_25035 [Gammaproteobacteria bacterium SG8_31]